MRHGTNYFVSLTAANRYYGPYGFAPADVRAKVTIGEIKIGKPEVKPGERLVLIDQLTRYAIEDET